MISLLGDARDGGERHFRRAEQQVAIAALERAFLAHGDAGALQRLARGGRRQILQPIRQRSGMRAAANAFAVGVEQDHLDAGHAVLRQSLGDLQAQPLDQVAGGELADIPSGIGITEL